ncbi:MAG: hypothetical protein HY720_10970 [Planctomycetes bacterium]|nr:hypothetical protein [Planctomycetota bacterium]
MCSILERRSHRLPGEPGADGPRERGNECGEPERFQEEEEEGARSEEDQEEQVAARRGTRGGESAREQIEGHLVPERRALTAAEFHEALGISEPARSGTPCFSTPTRVPAG